MAYDEKLAARLRDRLAPEAGLTEKKMFGGVGFMLNGNMCCGVHGEALIVRLAAEGTAAALRQPHTRPFDLTGRPMAGWVLVDPPGTATRAALEKWVRLSVAFASALPPKLPGTPSRMKRPARR